MRIKYRVINGGFEDKTGYLYITKKHKKTKKCSYCEKEKETNNFYKNTARYDGLTVYCISCLKEKAKFNLEKKKIERLGEQYIEGEIWKDIPEFKGYEASTEGRIRNKDTNNLMTPSIGASGYAVSSLSKNGEQKNIKFHRIIAQTFLPNFENKPTVEHKDDNKTNNRLYNLKWATHKEQAQYVIEKKTRPSQKGIKRINNTEDLEGEVWKTITKYPEYKISNKGRIKYQIRKGKEPYKYKISIGGKTSCGYLDFSLRLNNKKIRITIHRLVAIEFIPNPNKYTIVNHKDGNKQNNNVENLEWCSSSQNIQHGYDNDLISGKRKIYALNKKNEILRQFNSVKEAAEHYNICGSNIGAALTGRYKTSGGIYWCYVEKYDSTKTNLLTKNKLEKTVKQIDINTKNVINIFESISKAQRTTGINNICKCVLGKSKSAGGFKWEYE